MYKYNVVSQQKCLFSRKPSKVAGKKPLLVMAAGMALALPVISSAAILEEIVVSAQKREQGLQDVGLSVSAFSGDQLKALGYTETIDIAAQTPGFQLQQFHPSITVFNIRGVSQNDFGDHLEAPIAVFADEAYLGVMGAIHGNMYDVERVEVLRGPQGTLFGRNATGGIVHYISKRPTEETEAYASVTFGEHDEIKTEGAISGKLSEDVSGRLSFATSRGGGWLNNVSGTDYLDADSYSVRGQLLFNLSDKGELNLKLQHSNADENGHAYEGLTGSPTGVGGSGVVVSGPNPITGYERPFNDFDKVDSNDLGHFRRERTGVNVNFSWKFDSVTFTSVTDYLTMKKDYREDSDGSPLNLIEFYSTQDYDQFSQELRLNGEGDALRWVAGVYYLKMDADNTSAVDLDFQDGSGVWPAGVTIELESESYAVFGQIEYDLSENWMLLAGIRWTEDEREVDSVFVDTVTTDGSPILFNPSTSGLADQDWGNYSAKIELDWRPNSDWLYYASITRGHKAGNFAQPLFAPATFDVLPHDEEELLSYEVGFKGKLAEGSVRLNGSIFYYDYTDYQAFSFVDLTQAIFNKDATLTGGEVELTWLTPVEGLEVLLGISVLDGEVEDVNMPDGTLLDRDMPLAPDLSANALIRYGWEAFGGAMSVQLDGIYNDDSYYSVFNGTHEYEDSYSTANASISYQTANGHWRFTGFVRNLTDEEYGVYRLDVSSIGLMISTYAPPRTFGATIEYTY